MRYRRFGRTGWQVSEIGFGMFGMGGQWGGAADEAAGRALQAALDSGVNFFDTAWAYNFGHSERLLGELIRANPGRQLYTATKIPPKNMLWPSRRGYTLDETFPPDHIRQKVEESLEHLGLPSVDLIQFHVWEDNWAADERWQRAMDDLKRESLVRAVGVSINRWEPWNALQTIETRVIDAVEVIYNVFDQAPEDELFPLCAERDVAIIARVPFDEGTLTGQIHRDTTFAEGDWRAQYFNPENLGASIDHLERLMPVVPESMTLPEMALRFILSNPQVSTVIPGMRQERNVAANVAASDAGPLPAPLVERLGPHRWDRVPTEWSS
jgi:aryl-alcohol dehydrogenase-like predicted oxidoreductase